MTRMLSQRCQIIATYLAGYISYHITLKKYMGRSTNVSSFTFVFPVTIANSTDICVHHKHMQHVIVCLGLLPARTPS